MNRKPIRIGQEIDGEWTELTQSATDSKAAIVRITAPDLRQARQIALAVHEQTGADGQAVAVFLDLDVHVARDARTARSELATLSSTGSDSRVRYIGTVSGLSGLLNDIAAVGVADGVTLLPLNNQPFTYSAELLA